MLTKDNYAARRNDILWTLPSGDWIKVNCEGAVACCNGKAARRDQFDAFSGAFGCVLVQAELRDYMALEWFGVVDFDIS